jgi:Bacterial regulatory protein, Fis family
MSRLKLRQDDAISAITATAGNLSEAAERLGVCRQTLYTFAKARPKVQEAIAHGRAVIVDKAERKLVEAIEAGESWAIALTLRTLGKFRGWVEAKDLTPRGQGNLPQDDGVDTEDDWESPAWSRRTRPLVDELLDEPDADEDWPDSEPVEPEVDWPAREADLIASFQEERRDLLARIRALESATPPPPADEADDAAVMAELARLSQVVDALQQRLKGSL